MKREHHTVKKNGIDEIFIKKSRFISYVFPVTTEGEADDFLEGIRKENRDAAHNVFAYVIGEDKEIQKSSDDGEPSGTAGLPVLEVIKNKDLTNILIVVTRYFGGIKLGKGGLIRAYGKAALAGIERAKIVARKPFRKLMLVVDYANYGSIQRVVEELSLPLGDISYTSDVALDVLVPLDAEEDFINRIIEITGNNVDVTKGELEYVEK